MPFSVAFGTAITFMGEIFMQQGTRHIWIDVEDLFVYARTASRPSGIQRVVLEICQAMQDDADLWPRVRFVRHSATGTDFVPVDWASVSEISARLAGGGQETSTGIVRGQKDTALGESRLQRLGRSVPTSLRVPAGQMIRNVLGLTQATASLSVAAADFVSDVAKAKWQQKTPSRTGEAQVFAPSPGDVLLTLGASWTHATYGALLRQCKAQHEVKVAVLVHDLVPLLWPEWCRPGLPSVFKRWYSAVLPECDVIFTNSEATRQDVLNYAVRQKLDLTIPVVTVPMGSGFVTLPPQRPDPAIKTIVDGLGPYILCVGTLEARKNHAVLFRTWGRLLQERPASAVPKLVFAGCQGWLVDDLVQQIRNSAFLDGHLVWIDAPSDALVAALYQNCLFTVFPSFYEGWGLPVTESLAWGKACLISDRSSLPEAGAGLAESFDPDNGSDLLERIKSLLDAPEKLREQEAAIQAGFKAVPWSSAVHVVKQALGA